jgi:hypothetical protein
MNTLLKSFCLFFAYITPQIISAQPDPIKFGKIEKSLLEMKVYDKDTTADAVVLCDFGNFDAQTFMFTRIYRLKVLRKSGCSYANFEMSATSQSSIRGVTYNLENGEIVKTKLKNESIFEENYDKTQYWYRVAMPNVQVGSVIDITTTNSGIPSVWYFQNEIPIVWCELRIGTRSEVGIQKNFFGFQKLSISEPNRWVCKDMPALKTEPYMNSLKNFLTKFELEYSYINIPDTYIQYTTSWESVNNCLINKSTIGAEMQTSFFMGDEAKAINDTCKTERAKINAAYETIKKKIRWNESESLFPPRNTGVKNALNKGIGNAGLINCALYLLLKKLNIEVYPVALSTRKNGMLSLFLPSIDKLNYMIVLAKVDGQDILLDATDEFLPAGYLPQRCLNGNGRLVTEKSSVWIELKAGGTDRIRQYISLSFDKEGKLTGELNRIHSDYGAYLFRKEHSKYNDKQDYVKNFERNNPGLSITSSEVFAIDTISKPVSIHQTINYNGNIEVDDSTITFMPAFLDRITTNPFKLDERKIPVDFTNSFDRTYYYSYKIPDGYKIQEIPKTANVVLPDKTGKFIYRTNANDSTIQVIINFAITKPVFTQDEYHNMKQLFAEIVNKGSEPIILKKR